jgi:hypothetical protein
VTSRDLAEHVSRIAGAIVMPIPRVAIAFVSRVIVATADVVIRIRHQPATATSEREVLLFAVANAVVALAGVDVAWIEIGHNRSPYGSGRNESMGGLCEGVRDEGNSRSGGFVRDKVARVLEDGFRLGHHALYHRAVLDAVNARRSAPPAQAAFGH